LRTKKLLSGAERYLNCKKKTMMAPESIETQLALIRRELQEIHRHLCGDDRKLGLLHKVDELIEIADHGRWSLRLALWFGGGIVAATTALSHFKQALQSLFGHG